jgi:hypothetical protein
MSNVATIKIYWLATYSNMGLVVEHFRTETQYKRAVKGATEEHEQGLIDSYVHGALEQSLNLTAIGPC